MIFFCSHLHPPKQAKGGGGGGGRECVFDLLGFVECENKGIREDGGFLWIKERGFSWWGNENEGLRFKGMEMFGGNEGFMMGIMTVSVCLIGGWEM